VRDSDTVARIGGDEFAILLPRAGDVGAQRTLERIRESLKAPIQFDDGAVELSASVGIASCPADGETYDALLEHADRAMYDVKRDRHAGSSQH
jgi:diguanylate cyclase (GGDEF)-like protein